METQGRSLSLGTKSNSTFAKEPTSREIKILPSYSKSSSFVLHLVRNSKMRRSEKQGREGPLLLDFLTLI